MDNPSYLLGALGVLATGNLITRALPFVLFSRRRPPGWVFFIERNFSPVIMTILVLYTLRTIDFSHAPYGAREIAAVAVTALLHLWRGNYLLSIFGGTAFYMIVLRFF